MSGGGGGRMFHLLTLMFCVAFNGLFRSTSGTFLLLFSLQFWANKGHFPRGQSQLVCVQYTDLCSDKEVFTVFHFLCCDGEK